MLNAQLSKLPVSRPADWGAKVTICIGALCEGRKVVVAASDMLVTLGSTASDVSVFKNDVLFPRWAVMIAGDDTEHIDPILARAKHLLSKKLEHKTPQQVVDKLTQAYEERLQQEITAKVLSRYRFTPNTLRDTGKRKLTASVYNALAARIALVRIRLQFLVVGFDHNDVGHVLGLVGGDGAPVSYDRLGYWAIGEGAPMALASLGFFNHQSRLSGSLSIGECVYQVLAAKFMSESIKTVGRQQMIAIYGPDHKVRFISLANQQRIRDVWVTEGAPRIPKKIVDAIPGMLHSHDRDPATDPVRIAETQEWAAMVAERPWIAER